jgi:hypothetical protein
MDIIRRVVTDFVNCFKFIKWAGESLNNVVHEWCIIDENVEYICVSGI